MQASFPGWPDFSPGGGSILKAWQWERQLIRRYPVLRSWLTTGKMSWSSWEKQLNKLIDVIKLRDFAPEEVISRGTGSGENQLPAPVTRGEISELAALAGGKICDITRNSVTVEFCDTTERVENFSHPVPALRVERRGAHRGQLPWKKAAGQLSVEEESGNGKKSEKD